MKKFKTLLALVLAFAFLVSSAPRAMADTDLADGIYTIEFSVYKTGTSDASLSAASVQSPAKLIVSQGIITAQVAFKHASLTDITVAGVAAAKGSAAGDWTTYQFVIPSEDARVPVTVKVTAMGGAQQTIDLVFQEETAELSASVESIASSVEFSVYKTGTSDASLSAASVQSPAKLIVSQGIITAQVAFKHTSLTDITVAGVAAAKGSAAGDWTTYQFVIPSEDARVPVTVKVTAMGGAQQTIDLVFQGGAPEEVTVSGVAVKTAPDKVDYTAGDTLDLTGLVVTLTKTDSTTQDVDFADFAAHGITTVKANGAVLAVSDTAVVISVNGQTVSQAITVQASPSSLQDGIYTVALSVYKTGTSETATNAVNAVKTPAKLTVLGGNITAQVVIKNTMTNINVGGEVLEGVSVNGEWTTYEFVISDKNARVAVTAYVPAMGSSPSFDLVFQGDAAAPVTVSGVAIKTAPTKVSYTAGEKLNLTGLVVTLTKTDSTTQDVALADFAAHGITTVKANGATLAVSDTAVVISVNGQTVSQPITVQAGSSGPSAPSLEDGTYTIKFKVYKTGTTEASRSADSVKSPAALTVSKGKFTVQVAFDNTSLQEISVGGKQAAVVSTAGDWTTYKFQIDDENATVTVSVYVPAMDQTMTIDLAFLGDTAVSRASSGDGSDAATALTPTVTVTNGAAAVTVTSSELDDAIAALKSDGGTSIVIAPEITGTVRTVTVKLPKASLSSMASVTASNLTIKTPVGSVTLPGGALSAIADQATGKTVTVILGTVEPAALTEAQRSAVGDKPVYDVSIINGDGHISSFGGKSITVSLPYTLKAGEDPTGVTVWYLSDSGVLERLACTYDAKTGLATFTTAHLSSYVVGYDVWTSPFADVKTGDWYYEAVRFAAQRALFSGTSADAFSPNATMTRAMLVTVLYRLEGKPAVTGSNSFADVEASQWYTDAVIWANGKGIVTGYDSGLFGTNDPVSREQMAAILYRYAGYKKHNTAKTSDLAAFTDSGSVAPYALTGLKWANAEGLITGRTATTLAPAGTATRAEVATILMRFGENFVK